MCNVAISNYSWASMHCFLRIQNDRHITCIKLCKVLDFKYIIWIFLYRKQEGGNSKLCSAFYFFILKLVSGKYLHVAVIHEYTRWLYLSSKPGFMRVMLLGGTKAHLRSQRDSADMGPLWLHRLSQRPWEPTVPSLGFCFFHVSRGMLHEAASDSLVVGTWFAFLCLESLSVP